MNIKEESDRWFQIYRHWSFKPKHHTRNLTRTKRAKKQSCVTYTCELRPFHVAFATYYKQNPSHSLHNPIPSPCSAITFFRQKPGKCNHAPKVAITLIANRLLASRPFLHQINQVFHLLYNKTSALCDCFRSHTAEVFLCEMITPK